MVEADAAYYFTNLDTGETTTTAKASVTVGRQVYDGVSKTGLNTDWGGEIARRHSFDQVGDGLTRTLKISLLPYGKRREFPRSNTLNWA